MKTLAAIFIIIGLVLWVAPLAACQDSLETFYNDVIEQKVNDCIRKALLIGSRSENLRTHADASIRQAAFYKNNKEILVEEMIDQEIGKSRSKASYFLIKAYTNFSATTLAER